MATEPQPRFAGDATRPPAEVFAAARRNNPGWYRIMEQAYADFVARPENAGVYADPAGSGATLEQAWLVYTLFGVEPFCLLAHPLAAEHTRRITRLVDCAPPELMASLRALQAAEGEVNTPLLVHDGRSGHCIRLTGHEAASDRFVFHDPWPQGSLLEGGRNVAGVEARPSGSRWTVTAAELERIVFAAFALPAPWRRLQGEYRPLSFADWLGGEFHAHFQLRLLEEGVADGSARRLYTPAAFRDEVAVFVENRDSGRIVRGALVLEREWLRAHLPLALDIARHFVTGFAPAPERATFAPVADSLARLAEPAALREAVSAAPDAPLALRCAQAFLGAARTAEVVTELAQLTVGCGRDGERQLHQLEFVLP